MTVESLKKNLAAIDKNESILAVWYRGLVKVVSEQQNMILMAATVTVTVTRYRNILWSVDVDHLKFWEKFKRFLVWDEIIRVSV